jgi:hypothetical protein
MQKLFRGVTLLLFLAGSASIAVAGELKLTLDNGRATLIAQDVPVRQILEEWARIGKTTIVNGDKLSGPPITVQLIDRPEAEVLEVVLRSASGYIAAPRDATAPVGPSMFAKVMILPVSRGPVGVASATPPPFGSRQPQPQPMPMPVNPVNDDDANDAPPTPPFGPQGTPSSSPFQPPQATQPLNGQQPVITAPRPGMLPAPPAGQPNPYAAPPVVQPGVVRPPGGPGGPGGID